MQCCRTGFKKSAAALFVANCTKKVCELQGILLNIDKYGEMC